jgi:hypothetical protein
VIQCGVQVRLLIGNRRTLAEANEIEHAPET